MYSEFSYQFLLYSKNIYLGYPQFTGNIEVLLNSTDSPRIKPPYDSKISKDKYYRLYFQRTLIKLINFKPLNSSLMFV